MGENPSYLRPWVGDAGVVGVLRPYVDNLLVGVPAERDLSETGGGLLAGGYGGCGDRDEGLLAGCLGGADGHRADLLHRRRGWGFVGRLQKVMGQWKRLSERVRDEWEWEWEWEWGGLY